MGVTPPNSEVSYTVTIEASPELCQSNQGPLTADIRFPGFGFVSVNITLACECDCSSTVVSLVSSHTMGPVFTNF